MQLPRLDARLQHPPIFPISAVVVQSKAMFVMLTIRLLQQIFKLAVHYLFVARTMLQSLKCLTNVQRQACNRIPAYWGVAAASSQQQLRYLSGNDGLSAGTVGPGEEAIMGVMGTSVTKKLWQERLTKNKDRLKHLPLPTPTPKLPQQTAVTYAFSSDRFLQEQASNCSKTSVHLLCISQCA